MNDHFDNLVEANLYSLKEKGLSTIQILNAASTAASRWVNSRVCADTEELKDKKLKVVADFLKNQTAVESSPKFNIYKTTQMQVNEKIYHDPFPEKIEKLRELFSFQIDHEHEIEGVLEKVGIPFTKAKVSRILDHLGYLQKQARSRDAQKDQTRDTFYQLCLQFLYAREAFVCGKNTNLKMAVPALITQMEKTHAAKGHDYNDRVRPYSNCRQSEKVGVSAWIGVLIRISDKVERLCAFLQQGELKVKDEKIEDTCLDGAVYSLIGLILFEETLPQDTKCACPKE